MDCSIHLHHSPLLLHQSSLSSHVRCTRPHTPDTVASCSIRVTISEAFLVIPMLPIRSYIPMHSHGVPSPLILLLPLLSLLSKLCPCHAITSPSPCLPIISQVCALASHCLLVVPYLVVPMLPIAVSVRIIHVSSKDRHQTIMPHRLPSLLLLPPLFPC